MGEEFQGGVCGSMWWNPPHSLFSGGLSSPCSVVQLGGGFDMGNFGWPNKSSTTTTTTTTNNNNNQVFDNLIFQDQIDSSLDILGFGLSPTSSTNDWNHQNLMCNNSGSNEGNNFDPFLQDNMNDSRLYSAYSMVSNNSTNMVNSNNTNNTINYNNNTCQDASPPMTLTASSNSSGESSTITFEGGLTTSFPMNSSASYLIQSLFDDSDDQFINNNSNNNSSNNNNNPSSYGSMDSNEIISSNSWVNSWVKTSLGLDDQTHHLLPQLQLLQSNCNKLNNNGGIVSSTMMNNNSHGQILSGQYSPTTLNNIKASLLNSLQSRSRGPNSFNQKSQSCATSLPNEMNGEEHQRDSKSNNNDQPQAKRTRIETPSPLPTFKVRKEKLGDRITALQQLVSPFGKTDTASVLHEAIEYIKFLHDQVHVLSTPYLKSGTAMQQQDSEKSKDNEESRTQQDLRGRGLCLVPISSTYPVAQETPVDFWTPTFGGTTFR